MLRTLLGPVAATASLLLVTAACGNGASSDQPDAAAGGETPTEASGPEPRVAMTYDGGVLVLDAESGDVLLDESADGYLRLSPAGDARHAFLSASGGFTALDLGSWTEEHGDHGHSWTVPPELTDVTVAAEEPGHVVEHHGRTTLFDDATGEATALDPADLSEVRAGDLSSAEMETESWSADTAHHGVAYQLGHANRVTSVGDEETRSGIEVTTRSGKTLAKSDDCPGLHGEAFAGEFALFGCEDGAILLDHLEITKVDSPDDYGRIGNQAGHESSPFVLGDYKVDADAELERPTRVTATDTRSGKLELIDLPASYSFRSLGRTADGDGLVLGTDGNLHTINLASGKVTSSVPVVEAWKEPTEWQEPRPTLRVAGEMAYVSEPSSQQIHVVDLGAGKVDHSIEVPQVPDEILAVTG